MSLAVLRNKSLFYNLFKQISAHMMPSRISAKSSPTLLAAQARFEKNRKYFCPLAVILKVNRYKKNLTQKGLADKLDLPLHKLKGLESPSARYNIQALKNLTATQSKALVRYLGWTDSELVQVRIAAMFTHELEIKRERLGYDLATLSFLSGGYLSPDTLNNFERNEYTRADLRLLTASAVENLLLALDWQPRHLTAADFATLAKRQFLNFKRPRFWFN